MSFKSVAALAVWACCAAGCGSSRLASRVEPKPGNAVSLPAAHVDKATAGSIRGTVRFQGAAPKMPAIDFSSNPQCEREHKTPVRAETVVVNPNGTLKNVLVWIGEGLPEASWPPPGEPARLDQKGCIYTPHVLALRAGQELVVTNSDPVNHDVDAESRMNEPFNVSEPPRSQTISHRFAHQEVWFPVTCGVHPWMKSYVAVLSHPYFAVTGADGAFEWQNVPPGKYMIEARHELYGTRSIPVTVAPRGDQTIQVEFRAGASVGNGG